MDKSSIEAKVKELVRQYPSDNPYPYPVIQIPEKDLHTFISDIRFSDLDAIIEKVEGMTEKSPSGSSTTCGVCHQTSDHAVRDEAHNEAIRYVVHYLKVLNRKL